MSLWAERNGLGDIEDQGQDGSAVRRFEVYQVDPFLRWLMSLAGGAEVLEPPELRAGAAGLARETLGRYMRESDDG